jgi:hypothetical protein
MDAVTSFELEALRRRETVANDRDHALARLEASTERVEARVIEPRLPSRGFSGQPDCEPAPLARGTVG